MNTGIWAAIWWPSSLTKEARVGTTRDRLNWLSRLRTPAVVASSSGRSVQKRAWTAIMSSRTSMT